MTATENREQVGEQFLLNPNVIRSVRINTEYTNSDHLPKDIQWKPKGNMAQKKTRYSGLAQKGRPLWQDFGGSAGDLVNVSLAHLVVGLVNNGLTPVKAYNEERTGRHPRVPKKYRTTFVYMFPAELEHHPNREEILAEKAKLDGIRQRSILKDRGLRRDNMWGHCYLYVNPAYDNDAKGNPVLLQDKVTLDITAIYKTPLVDKNGNPIRTSNDTIKYYDDEMFAALESLGIKEGEPISPLYSIEVADRQVSLFRNRVATRAESYSLAKDMVWAADPESFQL